MDEKMQYADMLGITENTCNIVYKPTKNKKKHTKKADAEQVKKQLIDKVNLLTQEETEMVDCQDDNQLSLEEEKEIEIEQVVKPKKKGFKISVIGVQLAVICLLIGAIALTSILNTNSGINTFIKSVFGGTQVNKVDDRTFDEFSPVFTLDDQATYTVSEGIISVSGRGSVYSPCDGKILSLTKGEDGKYDVEIEFSKNFKAVFSGLDYTYSNVGDSVKNNIPIGFIKESGKVCFMGEDNELITSYTLENNAVKWEA